jgi:mono/diheme cytochrome c family protein
MLLATMLAVVWVWSASSGAMRATSAVELAGTQAANQAAEPEAAPRAILSTYCVGCHNQRLASGGLALDVNDLSHVGDNPVVWEKVVRKLRAGLMPPAGRPRPDEASYDAFRAWIESGLDAANARHPDPGRTEDFHRLNRAEYANAIRDLLALDIDGAEYVPADDSSFGFDNMAGTLKMSGALMERYLSAASSISRLAMGSAPPAVGSHIFNMAADGQQTERAPDLPFGTRGGRRVHYVFPQDGEYLFKIDVGGSNPSGEPDKLELSIDGRQANVFTLQRQGGRASAGAVGNPENKTEARVSMKAGPHDVDVTFFKQAPKLVEQTREPFENPRVMGNDGGHSGAHTYVMAITVMGPYNPSGPGDTPSRRRIFVCRPAAAAEESACAKKILSTLARRAYRGMGTDADVKVLTDFYQQSRASGASFEAGIESATTRLLVDPLFLFRIESDPTPRAGVKLASTSAGDRGVYALSDLQLASRLSFFLWSSIPDDDLLDSAIAGRLHNPAVLNAQVKRMLDDPRSEALTTNFAAQWLLLRNLANVRPGEPYLLSFDETLRSAFQRETELFFSSIVHENRSAVELLTANYTFLNERLARHYGIQNIQGSHFRRVPLPDDSPRRGILGQGSILTLTSHAIRTSPVIRGKWILNNILGTPPPDPPANVPALPERKTQARVKTLRDRIALHRENPVCASCHSMIDPAGFALENFDAIGRWRLVDDSTNPIDASGALPDGTKFDGVGGLREALTRRPERFVNTVTEKMLTYALGRGLEAYDMPAARRIVKDAARDNYRMQTVVMGIVNSYPFLNRRTETPPAATASAPRPQSSVDVPSSGRHQ